MMLLSPFPMRRCSPAVLLALVLLTVTPLPAAAAEDPAELRRQGSSMMETRRFAEAADLFREAWESSGQTADRRSFAVALASLAHAQMQGGNFPEARRNATRATELEPDDSAFHYLLAVILFRGRDAYYSRYEVRKALDLDPANIAARELLGDLQYQEGNLDVAIAEWEAALEGNRAPHPLKEKIDRARREMNIEEGLSRETSRHFVLQADGPIPRSVLRTVLANLEDAHYLIERELGGAPPGDIPVILYSRQAFQEATRSPAWVGGRYDGKIRIPAGGIASDADVAHIRPTLAHELTHAFLHAIVPAGLPTWLAEGLAEHFEGVGADDARSRLERLGGSSLRTLAQIDLGFRGSDRMIEAAYAAAALAVAALLEESGMPAVRRTLEAMGAGATLEKALANEARLSPEELEESWLRLMP